MVKISIKKEEKTVKPRQRQKQKQSQKVVVNIGSDLIKSKRKRAPRQALQKNKVINRQQSTPTQINVPQALPIQQQPQQQPMNELIKYLRESEKQKEIIKEKDQRINELEKDKKDKDRSKVLTKEETQDDFSRVYSNSNISSLTNSGTATPFFSRPVDPRQLYDLLRKEADLRDENPNSGNISVASLRSEPTITTLATNNTYQSSLSSFFDRSNRNEDLTTYFTQSPPKDPTETKMKTKYDELFEFELDAEQVVPPEVVPAKTDPVIDEILEEIEPENQLVVYGPQRATAQTATATQQIMGMDNLTIPSFLRPINAPSPATHLNDIIGQRPTVSETRDIRQARINKLDKKPLLAIEPQSTQDEANDTIKLLENILKPKPPIPTKAPPKETIKAEIDTEDNKEPTSTSIEGYDDFVKFITDKEKKKSRQLTNATLGRILIKNKVSDPATGKAFIVDGSGRVKVKGSSTAITNQVLTDLLRENYKPGFVYKKLS
jgi:hypothetical protein